MTSPWQSGTIETNGIHLHYTRTGGDKPPIVLIHGVTDDGLCWTPVAQALELDYDVIMIDSRGHGRSEATETGYGPATQARDHCGVIAALGLEKPILLGHSLGAITSLALAGLYPETSRAILLEDPPPFWMPPREPDPSRPDRPARGSWLDDRKSKTREELIAEAREEHPTWSEAELGPWADSKLRFNPKIAAVFSPEGRSLDWQATLPQITCPALAITADRERGSALSPEAAAALQKLVPHLDLTHIPGAGHNIRREQFDRYMQVVRDFLLRIGGTN
jgi:pimeloyl-ACP methyl ester carboxylesterase